MTVIGALSSFRELGEMSPHKRTSDLDRGRGKPRVGKLWLLFEIDSRLDANLWQAEARHVR